MSVISLSTLPLMKKTISSVVLAAALPLIFTGCGALTVLKPVKDVSVHHLLDSTLPQKTLTSATPAVAIGRPSLPGYLDRQQLISRSGDGTVQMNSLHLWTEPLDTGIARVVAENLSRLTGSLNIRPVDQFTTLDYTTLVELRVRQFEPDATGTLQFECTWKLQPVNGTGGDTKFFKTSIPPGALPDVDYSRRLAAMNEALTQLARNISVEISR